ncbi:hypothetical protein EU538_12265, partial [Candidatus Thorarchaeota archaeon]
MRNTSWCMVVIVSLLVVGPMCPQTEAVAVPREGPYLDAINYNVISPVDFEVSRLQQGLIDLIGHSLDGDTAAALDGASDIEVSEHLLNGYGCFIINCQRYPLNMTAFRRAAASALDKDFVCQEVLDGQAEPLDSVVPKINPFSVEGQLSYNYYGGDGLRGIELLDAAGFADVDSDGYREAPDGSNLTVEIQYLET